MASTIAPTFTNNIDQTFLIEPLGGDRPVVSYLDRFPEEVYNKSLDSHLVKFIYSLMGPAGIGSLRKNFLEARLVFEENGLELYNLDRFYGSPFEFGRISDESYVANLQGLLPQDEWEKIRAKDAKYRNRIIDFLSGARAGNTPQGMRLVARSGVGHEVEVIENYKALFDGFSDDYLGLPYSGKTRFLNEMIVVPREEAATIEQQEIFILGFATGGSFTLMADGQQTPVIPWNAKAIDVERALSKIFDISDIIVSGGPFPTYPIFIKYIGNLVGQKYEITFNSNLTGTSPQLVVADLTAQDGSEDLYDISPQKQHNLEVAIDKVRPVATITTFLPGASDKTRVNWTLASSSSEFDEMIRYVTGTGQIRWPARSTLYWVEQGIEHKAPKAYNDLNYHYTNFHDVANIDSYDERAVVTSEYPNAAWHGIKSRFVTNHIGGYEPHHAAMFQFLRGIGNDEIMTPDKALADYTEPLTIDSVTGPAGQSISLVNGIYPVEYQTLPGAPSIRYANDQFWSSRERTEGTEFLEIDLGYARAVNYITWLTTRKPLNITIDYDLVGLGGERSWTSVYVNESLSNNLRVFPSVTEQNPWQELRYFVSNRKQQLIWTRYLRIGFSRVEDAAFLTNNDVEYPWSVEVKNLRVGRSVANQ